MGVSGSTDRCSSLRLTSLPRIITGMDKIFIRDLRVQAIIGIHEHERLAAQTVSIDLDMASDTARAAASEDIKDALDYQRLSDAVAEFVTNSRFQLIETLAERVAELVQREFGVPWLRLTLHKPDALESCGDVGVIIERGAAANARRQPPGFVR